MHTAKLALIRAAQWESFKEILTQMQLGQSYQQALAHVKTMPNLPLHTISKYVPYLDSEGILRVGGRLDYCQDLVEEERHPAFLPPSHDITKLFILDRHEKLGHRAAEMVVAALRQDVGILLIGGTRTVRGYLADCFTCKLLRKTRAQQLMAPLPQYRVKPRQPVFSSISIDYAGPYEVKRARSLEKRWLCIFVCNLTFAVRVEVV